MGMKLSHLHRFRQASSGVIPYMGMKFATEISNIQRVGVIPYMGMKSSINHQ